MKNENGVVELDAFRSKSPIRGKPSKAKLLTQCIRFFFEASPTDLCLGLEVAVKAMHYMSLAQSDKKEDAIFIVLEAESGKDYTESVIQYFKSLLGTSFESTVLSMTEYYHFCLPKAESAPRADHVFVVGHACNLLASSGLPSKTTKVLGLEGLRRFLRGSQSKVHFIPQIVEKDDEGHPDIINKIQEIFEEDRALDFLTLCQRYVLNVSSPENVSTIDYNILTETLHLRLKDCKWGAVEEEAGIDVGDLAIDYLLPAEALSVGRSILLQYVGRPSHFNFPEMKVWSPGYDHMILANSETGTVPARDVTLDCEDQYGANFIVEKNVLDSAFAHTTVTLGIS